MKIKIKESAVQRFIPERFIGTVHEVYERSGNMFWFQPKEHTFRLCIHKNHVEIVENHDDTKEE